MDSWALLVTLILVFALPACGDVHVRVKDPSKVNVSFQSDDFSDDAPIATGWRAGVESMQRTLSEAERDGDRDVDLRFGCPGISSLRINEASTIEASSLELRRLTVAEPNSDVVLHCTYTAMGGSTSTASAGGVAVTTTTTGGPLWSVTLNMATDASNVSSIDTVTPVGKLAGAVATPVGIGMGIIGTVLYAAPQEETEAERERTRETGTTILIAGGITTAVGLLLWFIEEPTLRQNYYPHAPPASKAPPPVVR